MPLKNKEDRKYGVLLSTKGEEAYYEFLKILNEEELKKDEIEIDYPKRELMERLGKKGHDVTIPKINAFLRMAIVAQKSKLLSGIHGRMIIIK